MKPLLWLSALTLVALLVGTCLHRKQQTERDFAECLALRCDHDQLDWLQGDGGLVATPARCRCARWGEP